MTLCLIITGILSTFYCSLNIVTCSSTYPRRHSTTSPTFLLSGKSKQQLTGAVLVSVLSHCMEDKQVDLLQCHRNWRCLTITVHTRDKETRNTCRIFFIRVHLDEKKGGGGGWGKGKELLDLAQECDQRFLLPTLSLLIPLPVRQFSVLNTENQRCL